MPKTAPAPDPIELSEEDAAELAADVEQTQEKAKGTFDLAARIAGMHFQRDKIVLFQEPEEAKKYAEMQQKLEYAARVMKGVEPGSEQHQGLVEAYTAAEEEMLTQERVMMASALAVHLQAIPDPAHKKARRVARKAVGITGNQVPEELQENYVAALEDAIVGMAITQVIDADGNSGTFDRKTIGAALRVGLPLPQHARLIQKVSELVFNDALARQATSDPGF